MSETSVKVVVRHNFRVHQGCCSGQNECRTTENSQKVSNTLWQFWVEIAYIDIRKKVWCNLLFLKTLVVNRSLVGLLLNSTALLQ